MGSRLAHLTTTSCRASCARAQKSGELEAGRQDSSPFTLPKAGSIKRTRILGSYQSAI